MSEFISGVLTANKPGAQYEGAVYDRWLTLRHESGVSVNIFDFFLPIGTELSVGTRYEVILSALVPIRTAIFSADPPELPEGWWQGMIRQREWRVPSTTAYQYARNDFPRRGWLLVETPVGLLLMNRGSVPAVSLRVGDIIQWESTRLDLWAVV